jgi:hypothetical protein
VEVGVPGLQIHDLRHTAGTLASRAGATMREVMERLGHSWMAAAIRYQHGGRDAAAAAALDQLIGLNGGERSAETEAGVGHVRAPAFCEFVRLVTYRGMV